MQSQENARIDGRTGRRQKDGQTLFRTILPAIAEGPKIARLSKSQGFYHWKVLYHQREKCIIKLSILSLHMLSIICKTPVA